MKYVILAFTLLLVGCGSNVITNAVVQHDVPVSVPSAQPLTLNDVQFQVLTVDQLKTLLTKLQSAQNDGQVVFALDTQNYTNLQLNLVEIQRYIKEQKAIIDMVKQILVQRAGQTTTPDQSKPAATGK